VDLDAIPPAAGFVGTILSMLAFLWYALAKDVLVTGPAHRRELEMKDQIIGIHEKTIDKQDRTIDSLTATAAKLTVTGDLAAHSFADVARIAERNTAAGEEGR